MKNLAQFSRFVVASALAAGCGADDGILLAEILDAARQDNDPSDMPAEEPPSLDPEYPTDPTPDPTAEQAALEEMLLTNCGSCHGPGPAPNGGFDIVGDIDAMVARGLIVPSSSRDSIVWWRMQDGSMPPVYATPRPSAEDVRRLGAFIDAMPLDLLQLGAIGRRSAAAYVMSLHCATCHGGEEPAGGLGDITNLEPLVTKGLIVPGEPDQSLIYLRMVDGTMPPFYIEDRPTDEQLEFVEDYIEGLD